MTTSWPRLPRYSIGEVARLLGTNVSTLRYYEREGLLTPGRTAGGTRRYNDAEVARFHIAFRLVALGVPLRDIIPLVQARPGNRTGRQSSRKVLVEVGRLRETLERKRAEIDGILGLIDTASGLIGTCADCPRKPTNTGCPTCLCSRRFDESAILALTWSVRE